MSAETYKDCSCGRTFTREAWGALLISGSRRTARAALSKFRNCEDRWITPRHRGRLQDLTLAGLRLRAVDGTGEAWRAL